VGVDEKIHLLFEEIGRLPRRKDRLDALRLVSSMSGTVRRKLKKPPNRKEVSCPNCGLVFVPPSLPSLGYSYCSQFCRDDFTAEKKFLLIGWTVTDTGCWEWNGRRHGGYGHFDWRGKAVRCSRFSWERVNGKSPSDMIFCHKCDNPPCINPDHLFLGTHADNVADKFRKGRQSRGGWKWKKESTLPPVVPPMRSDTSS
jgi:HNH endonuclease